MIWNGVCRPLLSTDRSFRERIGAGNRLIVGTVATLIEQKGLRDLMAVAAQLRDHAGQGVLRSSGTGTCA